MALKSIVMCDGREYLYLVNPANGEPVSFPGEHGVVPISGRSDISITVEKAKTAHRFWRSLSIKERGRFFRALQKEIIERADLIARLIGEENGKNTAECLEEIIAALQLLQAYRKRGFSSATTFRGTIPNFCKRIITTIPPATKGKEFGVTAAIMPWNYPFMIPLNILTRCLFYGNVVVLKPSEQVPLCGELIRALAWHAWKRCGYARNCLWSPVQIVQGDYRTGKALVDLLNEGIIDNLLFCGSSEAGKKVKIAVHDKSKLELLLGGKDALIVLEDADLDFAVDVLVGGCLFNTGQSCSSIERVYVAESIAHSLVGKVVAKVKRLHVGYDPTDYTIDLGPVMNKRQFDIIMDHLYDAVSKGATILYGGKRLFGDIYNKGLYLEPTVLVNVTHDMDIMTEETFGPIIPIMVTKDEDELVKLANDSRFGLTASLWTKDMEKAERLARRIEVGTVYVNDVFWTAAEPKVHWPAAKDSGNAVGEVDTSTDKVIAMTRGNVIDRLSLFWLGKNTPAKVRLLKLFVRYGFLI